MCFYGTSELLLATNQSTVTIDLDQWEGTSLTFTILTTIGFIQRLFPIPVTSREKAFPTLLFEFESWKESHWKKRKLKCQVSSVLPRNYEHFQGRHIYWTEEILWNCGFWNRESRISLSLDPISRPYLISIWVHRMASAATFLTLSANDSGGGGAELSRGLKIFC